MQFLLACLLSLQGQTPVGSWTDHLAYNISKKVAAGSEEVFSSTGASVMAYNREYSELKKISPVNGLSETGISDIAWSEDNKCLVIGYLTANVDLLINNSVFNLPDIKNKYIEGRKEINRIRTGNGFAYLACSFGIVVIDLSRKEIHDTWKPGPGNESNEVFDLSVENGNIYAATEKGIYSASLSHQDLAYFANWSHINYIPDPYARFNLIATSGNILYVNKPDSISGDQVYAISNTSASLFSFHPGVFNVSFDRSANGFIISSPSALWFYNKDGSLIKTISSYGWKSPDISQAIEDNGDIWIADISSGLIRGKNMNDFSALTLPGPSSNKVYDISSLDGKTVICAGGVDNSWNNKLRILEISIFNDKSWTYISSPSITDPVRSVIDPDDNAHIFVSTWGGGLLEYRNNNLINHYTDANSPLQVSAGGDHNIKVFGLAIDKSKNLWMTQSEVPGSLKVLKGGGGWTVIPLTIDAPLVGDLIIAKSGYKWIILPGGNGIFVLDDNGTPDNFNDDRSRKIIVRDNDNIILSDVTAIAEDLSGNIWIGTVQGPLVYYNPEKVFDEDITAFRVKIPRNDKSGLSDYLLKNEKITSLAIDGANRKWVGTSSSGAFHISADGTVMLRNFNEENSPVFSDSIVKISVDNKTGDVWFGTVKGVQSFRGDATEGKESFTKVYAFPDPVREDFTGNVTITGLMNDSRIRITDISGNLVFETVSNGGMATWDLKTYNGRKAATGVYLIFCASDDGSQSFVTKMLIIKGR